MKKFAWIVSRIFDPFVLIPVILLGVTSLAYLNGYRWRFLGALFVLDVLIPGVAFLWMLGTRKIHNWDITKREERLPLYAVLVTAHALGVWVAYQIGRHPLAEILLALWLVAVVFSLVSLRFKISAHAGVNVVMAYLVTAIFGWQYGWIWLVPVVVGWSRVVVRNHSWSQVLLGWIVPSAILFLSFHYLEVVF